MPLVKDAFGILVYDFEGQHPPADTILYINGVAYGINNNFRDNAEVTRAGVKNWYRAVNFGPLYSTTRMTIVAPVADPCQTWYSSGLIICVDGKVLLSENFPDTNNVWKPAALRGPFIERNGIKYYDDRSFYSTPAPLFCPCVPKDEPPLSDDEPPPNIPPEEPPNRDETCECLGDILKAIADLAASIRDKATCEVNDCTQFLDKCLEKIVEAVVKELEPTVKSCNDCCEKIRSGAELAVADRIACATCECEEIEKVCSVAGLQPGEKCSQCGQENCCCSDNYECVPCEEEPESKGKYFGYCNANTGQVLVLSAKEKPPVGPWRRLSADEQYDVAYQEAVRLCVKPGEPTKPTRPPRDPSISGIPACDLNTFSTASNAGSYLQGALANFTGTFYEELFRAEYRNLISTLPLSNTLEFLAGVPETIVTSRISSALRLGPLIGQAIGCNEKAFQVGLTGLSAVGLFQQWTGVDIGQFCDPLFYALNATCRRKQLDIDKAMAAYLANAINDSDLDIHWAIAGLCPEALDAYKEAARSKPIPLQLASLRRRKMISEKAYDDGMRRLGYIYSTDRENLFALTEQLPTQSDLIRMMVRDTDNQSVVSRFGLDDQFNEVFQTQLKEWAESQGIPEKVMRYNWRAHWSIPSPTALMNMLHRLPVLGGFGDKTKVLEDVEAALIQQDILPFWIPRLLALSYNPLTRVDLRRAFNIGAIDEDRLYKGYLELGYDESNATALTKFSITLRDISAAGHKAIKQWLRFAITGGECRNRMVNSGLPENVVISAMIDAEIGFESSHLAKAFVSGELRAEGLSNLLSDHGVSGKGISKIIEKLSWKVKTAPPLQKYAIGTIEIGQAVEDLVSYGMAQRRAVKLLMDIDFQIDKQGSSACERGLKERYLTGELTYENVIVQLGRYGITQQRARRLADWWNCERSSLGKHIAASRLCEWTERGAISANEFANRLVASGYSEEDSLRIVGDCSHKIGTKRANEAIKMAKEEAAQQKRNEAEARRAKALLDREAGKLKRAAEQSARTRKNRQNQLLSASAKLQQSCQCDITQSFDLVRSEYQRVQSEYGLTPDESLQVLLQASDSYSGNNLEEYPSVVDLFAEQAASVPQGLPASLSAESST